jgi:BirA family transcriptional regulator, biotin operon repressor / biotin---[acetyl-CoA-carboxylase] ligase
MKAQILKMLESQNDVVSGEALSAALGISRVSVERHIHKLQELGYEIAPTPGGYRLLRRPDILFPWEYQGRAANILYFPEVASTMDTARDLAYKNCPDFTVVIAGRQTQGRGRLKRHWLSDDGGLYFPMVLRPKIPLQQVFRVNFLASLTLARVIRQMLQIDAMVKWPNDILVNERKISGILSELEAEADRVFSLNIGIGINVNNDPSGTQPAASSLQTLAGRKVSKKDLLAGFLEEFGQRLQRDDFDNVVSEWKKYAVTIGRQVKIITQREETEGKAVNVDENGALILELADGDLKKIIYGDCFLV